MIDIHLECVSRKVKANKNSEDIIQRLRRDSSITGDDIDNVFLDYISYKFMLDRKQMDMSDDLIELAKQSVQQAINNKEINYDQKDCHGTTESMTKKIMLVTAIEKSLNIKLSQEAYMGITSVKDLREAVCARMGVVPAEEI